MIIVKISGGLGNQLFQYAFGRYVSESLQVEVKYDLQTNLKIRDFTIRDCGLADLNLPFDQASTAEIERFRFFYSGFLSRLERKVNQFIPFNIHLIIEKGQHLVLPVGKLKDNCYYDGYWQSYKYLTELRNELISQVGEIQLGIKAVEWKKMIQTSISISIHIRRGDYISIKKNTDIFQVCGIDYYLSAINYIKGKITNPHFFIFSDDLAWAKENFQGVQFTFVEGNKPHEDMYLMSLCQHNIIANSTFSWWGAWLNSNYGQLVVAPKHWYVEQLNINIDNFILDKWIRL